MLVMLWPFEKCFLETLHCCSGISAWTRTTVIHIILIGLFTSLRLFFYISILVLFCNKCWEQDSCSLDCPTLFFPWIQRLKLIAVFLVFNFIASFDSIDLLQPLLCVSVGCFYIVWRMIWNLVMSFSSNSTSSSCMNG